MASNGFSIEFICSGYPTQVKMLKKYRESCENIRNIVLTTVELEDLWSLHASQLCLSEYDEKILISVKHFVPNSVSYTRVRLIFR